jgi:hypothetical protein
MTNAYDIKEVLDNKINLEYGDQVIVNNKKYYVTEKIMKLSIYENVEVTYTLTPESTIDCFKYMFSGQSIENEQPIYLDLPYVPPAPVIRKEIIKELSEQTRKEFMKLLE